MSSTTEACLVQANSRQVGGEHYRTRGSVQHWDICGASGIDCFRYSASKYVSRHERKEGRQGLEKAIHYLEKLTEMTGQNKIRELKIVHVDAFFEWIAGTDLRGPEISVLFEMLCGGRDGIKIALQGVRELIELRYPEPVEGTKPGTPEDGGHHARQAEEESETIPSWGLQEIDEHTLPETLTHHEYVHRCTEEVQRLYDWNHPQTRWEIKVGCTHYVANGRKAA